MTVYPRKLTGSCRNGAERDRGTRTHAILAEGPLDYPCYDTAVCGASPGKRSSGWTDGGAAVVDCPKCLKRLAAIPNPNRKE